VLAGRGLRLLLRRSKTDQRGAGQATAVWANPDEPGLCPAQALQLGWASGGAAAIWPRPPPTPSGRCSLG
jgi:hypothetical protein